MQQALAMAERAEQIGEVPVGAVLVSGQTNGQQGELLAAGHNAPISSNDPTAHAEIVTLRQAADKLQNYRLVDATLYVTLEPCAMCTGALVHARINRLVVAALEPKAGAVVSHPLLNQDWLNHRVEVVTGVCADASSQLLSDFFQRRRKARAG